MAENPSDPAALYENYCRKQRGGQSRILPRIGSNLRRQNLLHPSPHCRPGVGPVELVLWLQRTDSGYQGHLDIKYPVKDFSSESFNLSDLKVGTHYIKFSDPKSAGVANLKIEFRGERVENALQGTATTRARLKGRIVTVLGNWILHQVP